MLLAAYLALVTIGYSTESPRPTFSDNQFLNLVTKWDGEWYLNIAVDGYQWNDGPRAAGALPAVVSRPQARLAFFPAYPMLMRAAGWIVGNTIAGGLVVSLAAFLWALAYVFRLARDEIGDADAAGAVLLLAFYPFSIFYGVIYTESLFLLAAVGGLYHFRRAEWASASLWGLVIGLTRPNGFLLSVVLAAAGFERVLRQRRAGTFDAREWQRVRTGALVALMPVVGVLIYSAFCWSLSGDPLMWMRLHRLWGRGQQTLAQLIVGRVRRDCRPGTCRLHERDAVRRREQLRRGLCGGRDLAGLPPPWPGVRSVCRDQPDCAALVGHHRVRGQVDVHPLPAVHLAGDQRPRRQARVVDRHVCDPAGLLRGVVLHLALVLLTLDASVTPSRDP